MFNIFLGNYQVPKSNENLHSLKLNYIKRDQSEENAYSNLDFDGDRQNNKQDSDLIHQAEVDAIKACDTVGRWNSQASVNEFRGPADTTAVQDELNVTADFYHPPRKINEEKLNNKVEEYSNFKGIFKIDFFIIVWKF